MKNKKKLEQLYSFLIIWDIAQNSNGHNSVSFNPILNIQNSTDP